MSLFVVLILFSMSGGSHGAATSGTLFSTREECEANREDMARDFRIAMERRHGPLEIQATCEPAPGAPA